MSQTTDTQPLSLNWEYVADTVMGGVSTGALSVAPYKGRPATLLRGDVSLDSNGGFVQIASDLAEDGSVFDATAWDGIALEICGNSQTYDFRLRTDALTRPWQSFRTAFFAPDTWQEIRLPFSDMVPHKTDASFDPARLRRLGLLAIGREMQAEIAVASVALYRG